MTTDTSESGLERLICEALTGAPCDPPRVGEVREPAAPYGGAGWICGSPKDYDRDFCVDLAQLAAFLEATQPDAAAALDLDSASPGPLRGSSSPTRRKFLARLQGEITRRGTIDVLRHGIKHGPHDIDLFYGTPSPDNPKAQERYAANRFRFTRQLRYSRDETRLALDLGLLINGLPVATFELKNSLTKQTVEDAVEQYKRDRDPREKLFELGRAVVHFALDEHEARFCTHLRGKASWFLPFNQGWNHGAGNPPNRHGVEIAYLWQNILTRERLTVSATVGHAEHSGDLRRYIEGGKKIIISTVQKFPFILEAIGSEHCGRSFAIIIDEAHSSQGGETSAAMSTALSVAGADKLITEEIPARVAADTAYQNAQQSSDKQNARIEHDKALGRVMTAVLEDDTQLFKQFSDNESFRRWLTDMVFGLTYRAARRPG